MKLPPPATALIPPPRAPAKNRKMALCRFKRKFYHECGRCAKVGTAVCFGESVPNGRESPAQAHSDSLLSHFLTTSADPYMNGGFQSPSASEDLVRNPKASHRGDSR